MDVRKLLHQAEKLDLTSCDNCDIVLDCCKHVTAEYGEDRECREIAAVVRDMARRQASALADASWLDMYWKALKVMAQNGDFDAFMLYLERKRPAKKRFYQPRRRILREAVRDIQRLLDDELDEVFLSMPPRVGKTTLLLFLVAFVIALRPSRSNLYSAYSDNVTKSFYNGLLEILQDPFQYCWEEMFPASGIAATYAKEEAIDAGAAKRYHSITCRGIKASMNGSLDANGFVIGDDLLKGIEEALNPAILDERWNKIDNNFLRRAKESAKILWVGTRWATKDPIGRRLDFVQSDPSMASRRYSVIAIPALDDNDESNFDYDPDFFATSPDDVKIGFSTEYYQQVRASFQHNNDMASWFAQFQGAPVDRTGLLFSHETTKFFAELPEGEPDDVIMACDPAYGGGDFVSAPVGLIYGKTVYIPDLVFDASDKTKTRPRVVELIKRNSVKWAQFEKNGAGEDYGEWVKDHLDEAGVYCNVTSRNALNTTSKVIRIIDAAPEIMNMMFLEPRLQGPEYRRFMANLYSFTPNGRAKHDDAADSLAALAAMARGEGRVKRHKAMLFQRPF